MLRFSTTPYTPAADSIALFERTFAASEGPGEGAAIGALVAGLLESTAPDELIVATATNGTALAGAILFTRLRFAGP